MNLHRTFRVAALSLLCGFLLGGCSADDRGTGGGPPSFSEVKRFDASPVYYAGKEVAGLPLEGISGVQYRRDERSNVWNIGYGDCDPPSGLFGEGGCPLPLSVQNWSICYRWPGMYRRMPHVFDFRGAKAAYTSGLEIFTGRTTVVVFTASDQVSPKSATRLLRRVGEAQPPPRLPPTVPGSLRGKLPCQGRAG